MELPEHWGRDAPAAHGVRAQTLFALLMAAAMLPFLHAHPPKTHRVLLNFGTGPAEDTRFHRLDVTPAGTLWIDGEQVNLIELHRRLNLIEATDGDWVDFHPHAEARYELFLEVLAVTKRARLDRVRLDNSAFRRSIDRPEGR